MQQNVLVSLIFREILDIITCKWLETYRYGGGSGDLFMTIDQLQTVDVYY